jgi:hypothetical protein
MTQVCDFSDQQIDLSAVQKAGLTGCISYASDYKPKNWTVGNFDECEALGLTRLVVVEQGAQPALRGAAGGTHDAQIANAQANGLVLSPASTLFYCAEDPNQLDPSLFPTVAAYFTAINNFDGRAVGGYGGWALLSYLYRLGLISKGWMVETWNQGAPDQLPDWVVLIQLVNNVDTHGLPIDVDQVLQPDYGQDPRPTPSPQEGTMSVTATATHNGQKHVAQASVSVLWHKYWTVGPQGQIELQGNETLAGPGGGTAGGCSGNKVTVASVGGLTVNADGSLDCTFEGTDGSAWALTQEAGAAAWAGGRLS